MDASTILIALYSLNGFSLDSEESKRDSYLKVASAISLVATTPMDAAALIAQAHHETRLAKAVIDGRCSDMPKGMRCDPDKHGKARAAGPWQVWQWCKGAHTNQGSIESLKAGAACTLASMHRGIRNCSTWEGAFSALHGTGAGCNWKGAKVRINTMRKVLRYLQ